MNQRFLVHNASLEEETGNNYLVSVSDLMSGLIFIFILTLSVFVLQFKDASEKHWIAEEQKRIAIENLTNADAVRRQLLSEIQELLKQNGITVKVDLEQGILRLPEAILFPSGSDILRPEGVKNLRILAEVLRKILPQYTSSPDQDGNPSEITYRGKLEAVFIEGHSDDVPIHTANFADNWTLSAARAIMTYQTLIIMEPSLEGLSNHTYQPIFSVSGYADRRPVVPNIDDDARQLNRRIDLRFIMATPEVPELNVVIEQGFEDRPGVN